MTDRKTFDDSVFTFKNEDLPSGLILTVGKAIDMKEKLRLHFAFDMDGAKESDLREKVAKGEYVSLQAQATDYAPDQAAVSNLETWLKSQGFGNIKTTQDGIYAEASASDISKALQVNFTYVTKDGVTYLTATDAPSLPSDIGEPVRAIIGLQPYRRAQKHLRSIPARGTRVRLGAAGPKRSISNSPPYEANEILNAYNASNLGLTGNGQTIGILIDTAPDPNDVEKFWQINGLPSTPQRVTVVNVSGNALPAPTGEETLDVEWSSSIASGASVRVYAAGDLTFAAIDEALDQIITDVATDPSMRQVSISLGLGETFLPRGESDVQSQKYLRLAAAGVNVFVSSGDAGSHPDATGHNSDGPLQVEYAASDSSVIAVGGTSLVLGGSGNISSETGWSGSGGGISGIVSRAAWQAGQGVPSGNMRCVPDVSAAADPNEGALIVLGGQSQQIGGTSWSAPVWAGICALINEARVKAGDQPLTFLNPLIYPLMGTSAFNDITAGSNGPNSQYNCGSGYDLVSGLGSPNVAALVSALAPLTPVSAGGTSSGNP